MKFVYSNKSIFAQNASLIKWKIRQNIIIDKISKERSRDLEREKDLDLMWRFREVKK